MPPTAALLQQVIGSGISTNGNSVLHLDLFLPSIEMAG